MDIHGCHGDFLVACFILCQRGGAGLEESKTGSMIR